MRNGRSLASPVSLHSATTNVNDTRSTEKLSGHWCLAFQTIICNLRKKRLFFLLVDIKAELIDFGTMILANFRLKQSKMGLSLRHAVIIHVDVHIVQFRNQEREPNLFTGIDLPVSLSTFLSSVCFIFVGCSKLLVGILYKKYEEE